MPGMEYGFLMAKVRRGFTLVEIMVVVFILGVLIAIAVPSWRQVRQNAREKACAATCKKIDQAKQQWMQDNNLPGNSVPTVADLYPAYLKTEPVCSGGTITMTAADQATTFTLQ